MYVNGVKLPTRTLLLEMVTVQTFHANGLSINQCNYVLQNRRYSLNKVDVCKPLVISYNSLGLLSCIRENNLW